MMHPTRRQRDDDGFILASTLIVMLLLVTTSMLLLSTLQASTSDTRASRATTEARQQVDVARGAALDRFNGGTYGRNPISVSNSTGGDSTAHSSYSWSMESAPPYILSLEGSARAAEGNAYSHQSAEYPLRGKVVASQSGADPVAYGVMFSPLHARLGPAGGAFDQPLSTSTPAGQTSVFNGELLWGSTPGQWTQYGSGTDVQKGASNARFTSHNDESKAKYDGADARSQRSTLTAYMDTRMTDQMRNYATSHPLTCTATALLSFLQGSGGWKCWSLTDAVIPAFTGSSGIRALYVPGDVVITGNISQPGGNLWIIAGGDVIFSKVGPGLLSLQNVYIYAPDGRCRLGGSAPSSINMIGALACKQVLLDTSSPSTIRGRWTPGSHDDPPAAWGVDTSSRAIFYTERSSFVDGFSQ